MGSGSSSTTRTRRPRSSYRSATPARRQRSPPIPTAATTPRTADGVREALGHATRLVSAVGADFGVVFDRSGERIYLVDEQAHEVPVEQERLLFLSLLASDGKSGTLALQITVTSLAEPLVKGSKLAVTRTPASLSALSRASADNGVVFAGSVGGGFVFPEFLPAYDGVASLCNLLSSSLRSTGHSQSWSPACRRVHGRPPAGALPSGTEGRRHAHHHRAHEGEKVRHP